MFEQMFLDYKGSVKQAGFLYTTLESEIQVFLLSEGVFSPAPFGVASEARAQANEAITSA